MGYAEDLKAALRDFELTKAVKPKTVSTEVIEARATKSPILVFARKASTKRRILDSVGEDIQYNYAEITRIEDTESLLSTSFRTHLQHVMREGFLIRSEDMEASDWVMHRLFEMELLTGRSTTTWLREAAQSLIKFSNAFLVFAREGDKSSGRDYRYMGKNLHPIVGVFIPDPGTVRVRRDHTGKVLFYRQYIPMTGQHKLFRPWDILHITYNKKEGLAYGTPYCIPVLDDIRTLRRLEEYTELLTNAHTFPLYHYKVGTDKQPATINPQTGQSEIDIIKEQVEDMPTEGAMVTDHRHEITVIGAEGEALDLKPYLEYFKQRVKDGLGVSDIQLGQGGTSNRNTAQSLDKKEEDNAKDFQSVIAENLCSRFFIELLLDGSIKLSVNNRVTIQFNEINKEEERNKENHEINKFNNSATTHPELRRKLRLNPMKEDEWTETTAQRVGADILDRELATQKKHNADPYTLAKLKAAQAKAKANKAKSSAGSKTTASKSRPSNQHGTSSSKPRISKNSSRLKYHLDNEINFLKHHLAAINGNTVTAKYLTDKVFRPHLDKIAEVILEFAEDEMIGDVIDNEVVLSKSECREHIKNISETFLQPELEECIIKVNNEDRYEDKNELINMVEAFRPRFHSSATLIQNRCRQIVDSGEPNE